MISKIQFILLMMLLPLLGSLLCLSVRGESWVGIDYGPYNWFAVDRQSNELCSFTFPPQAQHSHYPAFLVTTNDPQDLTDCLITCVFEIESSPGATFRYGGQGDWNIGSLPANARLCFMTVTGYYNQGPHTNYWFNGSWVAINNMTGTAMLTATMTPGNWSDGQGQIDSNACAYAMKRVVQVGAALGGGNYFDTGMASSNGIASFHLKSFTITKQLRFTLGQQSFLVIPNLPRCFYRQQLGGIFYSTNLIDWRMM